MKYLYLVSRHPYRDGRYSRLTTSQRDAQAMAREWGLDHYHRMPFNRTTWDVPTFLSCSTRINVHPEVNP